MHDEEPEDLDEEFEGEDPGVDPALARAAAEVLGRVSRGQARGLSFEQAVVLLLERVGNLDRDRLEGISLATGDWYHELDDPDDLRRRERTWMLWCCDQLASCAVAALTLALVVTLQLDEHNRGRGGEQAALEEVKVMLNDELAISVLQLLTESLTPGFGHGDLVGLVSRALDDVDTGHIRRIDLAVAALMLMGVLALPAVRHAAPQVGSPKPG